MNRILRFLAPWLATAAALAAAPLVFRSNFALTTMSLIGINVIFALSFNILLGQTGLLSFGHAVYYGLGAFVAIHALNAAVDANLGLPLPLFVLVGGLGGLFFGYLFGVVVCRRGGLVFSMITLGVGELVSSCSFILRSFFGGEEGIVTNRTGPGPFLGYTFGPQIQVYYLTAAWCFLAIVATYALTRTPLGRVSNAARENPERAEFLGYKPETLRLYACCFAALFAGIAGALSAINFEIATSELLGSQESTLVLLMAYVGGTGHFVGPILGAALVTYMQIRLSDLTDIWQLYFGVAFIGVVLLAPGGIAGWVAMHVQAWRRGELARLLPSYALAAPAIAIAAVGAVLVIELTHRLFAHAMGQSTLLRIGPLALDAQSAGPWALAGVLALGGGFALRWVWPRVRQAWGAAASGRKGSAA